MEAKTLFFDIGNVLIFFSPKKMINKLAEIFQSTYQNVQNFIAENNVQKNYELGLLSTEELYSLFCSYFGTTPSLSQVKEALVYTFSPNTDVLPLLKKLKEHGHQLILLSNTCDAHYSFLEKTYPFLEEFDDRILSHRIHLRKPDPKIYQFALSKAKHPAFFIDDLEENVTAANQSGLTASVYQGIVHLESQLKQRSYTK